jgi:Co/Zn/Cd efflux system component
MGNQPEPTYMIFVGLVALVANITCLRIIARHRRGEVHMRASWIFSRNDVIANIGVVTGGAFVYFLDSRWPDLLVGFVVSLIVLHGGIRILKEAHETNPG